MHPVHLLGGLVRCQWRKNRVECLDIHGGSYAARFRCYGLGIYGGIGASAAGIDPVQTYLRYV